MASEKLESKMSDAHNQIGNFRSRKMKCQHEGAEQRIPILALM